MKEKVRFYADAVRREIRSGGEAIKALEVLERELCAALESEEVVAEGWAMPEKAYYKGNEWVRDKTLDYWGGSYHMIYERQVRVYLDRAPRGSRRVRILAVKEE